MGREAEMQGEEGALTDIGEGMDLARNPRVPLRFTRGYITDHPNGFSRHGLTFDESQASRSR